jgi:glutathione S-transferase
MEQYWSYSVSTRGDVALHALHENDTAFSLRLLTPEDEHTAAEFARLSPLKKFPLLRDGERVLLESSVIIEYLMRHHPGPVCMLPSDPDASFVRVRAYRQRLLARASIARAVDAARPYRHYFPGGAPARD